MKVAVTGADGFLGWHLRCALFADGRHDVVEIRRPDFASDRLRSALSGCDAVIHLAGVNRGTAEEVENGNRWLAQSVSAALDSSGVRLVVHGNSIHAGTDTPFGRSKAYTAEVLAEAAERNGAAFTDMLLPNVFGERGRPHYNSFVATFCHELASGREPRLDVDREVPLIHAQDVADEIIDGLERAMSTIRRPEGRPTKVSDLLEMLRAMIDYPRTGDFPDLSDPFKVALFNTFQSFCFPSAFPIGRRVHADGRGQLFESHRARGTDSLSFVSTTVPGAVRGQHFHRRKVERFLVVAGEAEIRLSRMCAGEEIAFQVSGSQPRAVDMPPLWAHSIKNVGQSTLTTVFWTNELLDPGRPDTFRFPVYPEGTAT